MGGRGKHYGKKNRQYNLGEEEERRVYEQVLKENELKRALNPSGEIGGGKPILTNKYKKCACCGNFTIPVGKEKIECPECGWIDDSYQNQHPDSLNGANSKTLRMAREEYAKKIENDQSG